MICGIYKIENKINGKVYIGQSVNIKRRWTRHKRELNNNIHGNNHLQRAWNEYGSKYFSFELIKACKPKYLNRFEKLYIRIFDSMDYNKGYNNDSGGFECKQFSEHALLKMQQNNKGKNNPMYGRKHSEETKTKIAKSKIGKKRSKATIQKMIQNRPDMSGENNPMYGKHHTEETRKLLSELNSGENNYWYGKTGKEAPCYGHEHSKETRELISMNGSKSKNTSGYYRVSKLKDGHCKQGFIWRYLYYENGKQKVICSVDIHKLEEKVKNKGLKWFKFEEELNA